MNARIAKKVVTEPWRYPWRQFVLAALRLKRTPERHRRALCAEPRTSKSKAKLGAWAAEVFHD